MSLTIPLGRSEVLAIAERHPLVDFVYEYPWVLREKFSRRHATVCA
jgi:hypothetical protein